jgi:hypothetical protein
LLLLCKDSANRVKKKINLVYFFFRGAAYLIQSSANWLMKKKIKSFIFSSEVPPVLSKVVQTCL